MTSQFNRMMMTDPTNLRTLSFHPPIIIIIIISKSACCFYMRWMTGESWLAGGRLVVSLVRSFVCLFVWRDHQALADRH